MGQLMFLRNDGDAPAPYIIQAAFPDASSKVAELLLAMRSSEGVDGAKRLADLNETGWADLAASARGWIVTLENNTTSVNDSANGGVGNSAQIDGASANVGVMLRRVRLTRTTKLDSLRGWEYVLARVRSASPAEWELQLRFSASLADPAATTRAAVRHVTGSTAPLVSYYVEVPLGFLELLEDPSVSLPGVALEIWARRISGSGNLFLDLTRHLPATPGKDLLTRIIVPAASPEVWLGRELVTPVTSPGAGTAGVVSGDALVFDTTTDNAGAPPNTGLPWPAGQHRVEFDIENLLPGSTLNATVYVRNVTDNNDAIARGITHSTPTVRTWPVEFDSVAGKSYQPQVRGATPAGALKIHAVRHYFRAYAVQNEQFRGDPLRWTAEKLEADGDVISTLKPNGPVPLWVPPGLAAVFAIPLDVIRQNYTDPESVKARTLTLSGRGALRRYQ